MARLIVTRGDLPEGRSAEIEVPEGELTLGRSRDNDVTINEPSVSRRHAVILRSPSGTVLRDLGSANGTFINKLRITEQPLHDGDVILLGRAELRFEAPEELSEATVHVDMARHAPAPPAAPAAPPQAAAPPPPAAVPPPVAPRNAPPPPVAAPPAVALPPRAPTPPAAPPPPVARPQAPPPPAAAPPAVAPSPQAPAAVVPPPSFAAPSTGPANMQYAGFWIRLLAYLIDGFILALVEMLVFLPAAFIGKRMILRGSSMGSLVIGGASLVVMVFSLWYILHFWARDGATPGKKLLHLKIIREDGVEPLGMGTAIVRLIGYMLSSMVFSIGFLMVAFTDRKRGLHDMIAKTVVIKVP